MQGTKYTIVVSIHASLAGGDWYILTEAGSILEFQSTPPLREATPIRLPQTKREWFQSTPPLREATETSWW